MSPPYQHTTRYYLLIDSTSGPCSVALRGSDLGEAIADIDAVDQRQALDDMRTDAADAIGADWTEGSDYAADLTRAGWERVAIELAGCELWAEHGPSLAALTAMTSGLSDGEWHLYADRLVNRWPALGAWTGCHAESVKHDAGAPPVEDWPALALADAATIERLGVAPDDVDGARAVWQMECGVTAAIPTLLDGIWTAALPDGRRWWPSVEAQDEINTAEFPAACVVRLAVQQPERGTWS